jgi:hypothetical protein
LLSVLNAALLSVIGNRRKKRLWPTRFAEMVVLQLGGSILSVHLFLASFILIAISAIPTNSVRHVFIHVRREPRACTGVISLVLLERRRSRSGDEADHCQAAQVRLVLHRL